MRTHGFIITATVSIFLGILVMTGSGSAYAGDAAADLKYRQSTMKSIGAHMGAIVATIKGQAGTDASLIAHAKAMAATAGAVSDIFPSVAPVWARPKHYRVFGKTRVNSKKL